MTRKPIGFWICIYAALAMMAVYNLLPFFWMATSALKSEIEVVSYPATLWPREITFAAYSKIWLTGLLCATTITTIHYIARHTLGAARTRVRSEDLALCLRTFPDDESPNWSASSAWLGPRSWPPR